MPGEFLLENSMQAARPNRINLALSGNDLRQIDYYWHSRQLGSRQQGIKELVSTSLSGRQPEDHSQTLQIMQMFAAIYGERRHLGATEEERVHIDFSQDEMLSIDAYRTVARITTRSKAIRKLAIQALQEQFPEEHIAVLQRLHSRPLRRLIEALKS